MNLRSPSRFRCFSGASRSILCLPLLAPLGCSHCPTSKEPAAGDSSQATTQPAGQAGTDLPPASISPPLDNDTNPPMVARGATGTLGSVSRLDPGLDNLLAPDAKLEVLVENVQWAEGPVWSAGGLFFSDVPQNTLYRWTPTLGVRPYLKPSGYTGTKPRGGEPGSNGLTLDHEGRLTICQHGDRRVVRLEEDGRTLTVLADRSDGKRFSSPNDLCYDSKGNLYFTDPPYGLEGKDADPAKEMDVNGVYLRRTDGTVARLDTGTIDYPGSQPGPVRFPNGIALSPDERSLYVCVSDPDHPVVLRYAVRPDGTVADGKVFFDATALAAGKLPGLPDGMKLDHSGNLWVGGPGGILILTPDARHLGTILTGVPTANCAWGDDGSTLYVTANHNVCRIRTKVKGILPGPR